MKLTLEKRQNLLGWTFLMPATLLIALMSFWPMVQAFILSLSKGKANNISFAGLYNYKRLLVDPNFKEVLGNTFLFLIVQVPIMLLLAILLAVLLNKKDLKFKAFFRTAIFLPCATSLVSYAIVFRALFAENGFINLLLSNLGIISENINWLGNTGTARLVIILALIWRWTGYNMIFFLSGLQNINPSVYEAARIDGANDWKTFWKITVPLLKPMLLLTAIMSTTGTLQLFDESVNLTSGGPGNSTMTISYYIYNFINGGVPNFTYSAAISYVVFIIVAVLAFIQLKVGDSRE